MNPRNIDFDNLTIEMSENNSLKLWEELSTVAHWRCYNKNTTDPDELSHLIDRYIDYHATIPGSITEETLSSQPMDTFGFTLQGKTVIKGLLYMNGAVVQIHRTEPTDLVHYVLFIDERVAAVWAYPEGYIVLPEHLHELGHIRT